MLKEAETKLNDCDEQPKLPLLRLRILYEEEKYIFNANRYGGKYKDKVRTDALITVCNKYFFLTKTLNGLFLQVANFSDMLKFKLYKKPVRKDKGDKNAEQPKKDENFVSIFYSFKINK